MRRLFLLLIIFFTASALQAQLTITAGAEFHVTGSGQITLNNVSLTNHGLFNAGTSTFMFSGTANSSLGGTQPIQFYELQLNKQGTASLVLQRNINVSHRVIFTSGLFHLGISNIDLGTTGILDGENENARITANGSGQVISNANLNAPNSANPGNLGAIVTSSQNLGNVIIRRGHESQQNASGLGSSIRRYYDLIPSNNNNLNATLRIQYLD